jgi:hypothetical protein
MTREEKKKYEELKIDDSIHGTEKAKIYKEIIDERFSSKLKKLLKYSILITIITSSIILYKMSESGEIEKYKLLNDTKNSIISTQVYQSTSQYLKEIFTDKDKFKHDIKLSELASTNFKTKYHDKRVLIHAEVMGYTKSKYLLIDRDFYTMKIAPHKGNKVIYKDLIITTKLRENNLKKLDSINKKTHTQWINLVCTYYNLYSSFKDCETISISSQKKRAKRVVKKRIIKNNLRNSIVYGPKREVIPTKSNYYQEKSKAETTITVIECDSPKPVRTTIDMNLKDKIW